MGVIGAVSRGVRIMRPFAETLRSVDEASETGGRIALLPGHPEATRRIAELIGPPEAAPAEDALGVLAAGRGTDLDAARAALAHRRRSGAGALAIVVGTPRERAEVEAGLLEGHDLEASNVTHVDSLSGRGADAALDAVVRALGDEVVAAARHAPGLRAPAARRLVRLASRRSAMLGTLPVGGADLPALALLQVRLVAELAALHGRPLGPERAVEAAMVAGAGFGWRAVGRSAVGLVPGAGWAVRGAVAYGATRAVGEAACARLAAGHDLIEGTPLEAARPAVGRVLAKLPGQVVPGADREGQS